MCTLTLLRAPWVDDWTGEPPLWRLVFSRDERRDRPQALPPEETVVDGVHVVAPIDPVAGGTWLAVTSAGLVFALMNEYEAPATAADASRGLVIPSLVAARSRIAARRAFDRLELTRFQPFRLVVADGSGLSERVWDGHRLRRCRDTPSDRVVRTSSAVDGRRVRACRTALFTHLVPRVSRAAQNEFHAATWPANPAMGVAMSRDDACTVSVTAVDVFARRAHITYRPTSSGAMVGVTDLGLPS